MFKQPLPPMKPRLDEKLKPGDLIVVKQAFYQYIAKTDPNLLTLTFENMLIEDLLPILKDLSSVWKDVEASDFSTGYVAINAIYHSLRNAFKSPDRLKQHVLDWLDENMISEEAQSRSEEPAKSQPKKSTSIDNVSKGSIKLTNPTSLTTRAKKRTAQERQAE